VVINYWKGNAMTTHSNSCLAHSLLEAEHVVDQLRAANFSMEEISMLVPGEKPVSDPDPLKRTKEREAGGKDSGVKDILISVHLEEGCGMNRAEEIFRRVGSC
jgi:hypothetical protein